MVMEERRDLGAWGLEAPGRNEDVCRSGLARLLQGRGWGLHDSQTAKCVGGLWLLEVMAQRSF